MRKKVFGILAITLLCGLLLFASGCGDESAVQESSQNALQGTENAQDTQNALQGSTISKIDDTKEIVYSVFDKSYDYFEEKTKIQIPAINLDVEAIKELNSAIMEDYQEEIERSKEFADHEITYEYFENGDIVSIVIKNAALEMSIDEYKVYNVNVVTGEVLSKEAVLNTKNITKETYESKIKEQISAKFEENYASLAGSEYYETQKEKNNSDENCSLENTQVFIGENGNIHYIANIYSMAGADKYQNEFDYGE